MRILLVGEYSGLHNSLKEGLMALGHEVTLISSGDGFKNYPNDIMIKRSYDTGIAKKIKLLIYKTTGVDITARAIYKQILAHKDQLKDYDVVQLINERSFVTQPETEMKIVAFLRKFNNKLFLLSCGSDVTSIAHMLSDAHPYSIFKGYKDQTAPKEDYKYLLLYTQDSYKKLHRFIFDAMDGVIASDLDYHIPLKGHPKYKGLIANPIHMEKLDIPNVEVTSPITIFMGINRGNYHFKGITYFEQALEKIKEKYGKKVQVEIVENVPYSEYINKYNNAHILLDQVLAYDQGYNALEAMAKGKVVFTGAEKEFEDHYYLTEPVAINALPDVEYLVNELEKLVENPYLISEIGKRAKAFVALHHDHIKVASKYVEAWGK